jgi:NADPH2:quinone reductase
VTFRTRSTEEVREVTRRMLDDLWDDVVAGRLGLPVDRVFPFAELPEALAHMAANRHFGKVVVTV